ncbi:MAG: bifunctional 2',3'-cyclic-nucleotide 2'-phosphodiesterase/3'-nucleotidase, partial [Paracoccaceae bacterium]
MTKAAAGKSLARLRVLATSDLHCQISAWDYLSDRAAPDRGLTRIATLIASARAEVADCLLLDNGDFIQGSPLGDLIAASPDRAGPHPMIAAMNHLRYDAATLGNHEFSHGLSFLNSALREVAFPVVSANIAHSGDDRPFCPPFVILHRQLSFAGQDHDLKIGVIGFAPPQLEQWDHQHIAGRITTRDILLAAAEQVPLLRAQGVDLVIALSHSGVGSEAPEPGLEDATVALAAQAGIDVVIAGHTHLTFPSTDHPNLGATNNTAGTLHDKPAVMPGFFGSHLGVIDLWLSREQGAWRIARHRSALRAIARRDGTGRTIPRVRRDPAIEAIAAPAHAETLQWARQKVADSRKTLHSYFALIHPCPTVRIVTLAQREYVRQALAGSEWADLPILSAAAPFRAGGRGGPQNYTLIPRGDIAKRHVADLYIHPNTVTAIEISGAELAEWLERSAGLFHQIVPGVQDQPLINPDFPSFNFDCIEGVSY